MPNHGRRIDDAESRKSPWACCFAAPACALWRYPPLARANAQILENAESRARLHPVSRLDEQTLMFITTSLGLGECPARAMPTNRSVQILHINI
jgi:hypothetical protein